MYSSEIVEKRLFRARKKGLKFQRRPYDRCIEIASNLEKLTFNGRGEKLPIGSLIRPLDTQEREFIVSEQILCKADFSYYLSRYHTIEKDSGVGHGSGIGAAPPLPSQDMFIHNLGKREEVCVQEMKKYNRTDGILVYAHKARQVSFTTTSRAASLHRMLFYPGTRAFAATLKEGPQGTGELYSRDTLTLNNLPFWLKPSIYPNVKDEAIGFEDPLNCRLSYQAENQSTGIGTGTQQDVSHLTEVSLWTYPLRIRYSFYPSIPKSISTLHIQEATSAGKGGYWQEVTEGCRKRRDGYESWTYIFVPWYINFTKYVSNPPDDWRPNEHTKKHAELVERTSPEFSEGTTVHPTRDQLYWWEKTRALHIETGELALFLANYPATPEQSFTNWAQGALPVELIEEMELNVRVPVPYAVLTGVDN